MMQVAGTMVINAGVAQLARASAFQAEGRGFESRFPLLLLPTTRCVEEKKY